MGKVMEPIRVWVGVVVNVSDDFARRRFVAGIAGVAQPPVLRADHSDAELAADRGGRVLRTIIDEDRLEVRVFETLQGLESVADSPRSVVAADDN